MIGSFAASTPKNLISLLSFCVSRNKYLLHLYILFSLASSEATSTRINLQTYRYKEDKHFVMLHYKSKPKFYLKRPDDLDVPQISFDEFVEFESEFEFKKLGNYSSDSQLSSPSEAAKSMRVPLHERSDPACYYTSLAYQEDFYNSFKLPQDVSDVDLYSNFCPQDDPRSSYLKERSKLFYGYHENYRSVAYSPYAGMAEWIHVRFGELKLIVFIPKDLETVTLYLPDLEDTERPISREEGIYFQYKLKRGSFIIIPPGAVSIKYALKDTFCFAGEYIQFVSIRTHLVCFKRDEGEAQLRIQVAKKSRYLLPGQTELELNIAAERDRDIRAAFFILKEKLIGEPAKLLRKAMGGAPEISLLKSYVKDWTKDHLICLTPLVFSRPQTSDTADEKIPPKTRRRRGRTVATVEDPTPIEERKIKNPLKQLKAIEYLEDSIDILMDQTASHNKTQ